MGSEAVVNDPQGVGMRLGKKIGEHAEKVRDRCTINHMK